MGVGARERVGVEEPSAARKVVVVVMVGEGDGVGKGVRVGEATVAVTTPTTNPPVVDGVFEGVAPRERVGVGVVVGEGGRLPVLVLLGLTP